MDWTEIGKEVKFEGPDEEAILETEDERRARIIKAIEFMEWHRPGDSVGMSQGMAINTAVKEFKIPRPSRFGISSGLAPYGLYAIVGTWKDGLRAVYFVDDGCSLTPVGTELITS